MTPARPVGAGQFGLVFLTHMNADGAERATKVLRPGATTETQADFLREAEILAGLDHPAVVRLLGVCLNSQPWLLVEEFACYGDLDTVLRAGREKGLTLRSGELLELASQIAVGLAYVAAQGVVHCDIAARNVLLHEGNSVRIADFGWARRLPPGKASFTRAEIPKISTRWLAIESIERREFSEKSDVWSFGVTIWELYSHAATPYPAVHFLQVPRLVKEGMRLERPLSCPHDVWAVAFRCWHQNPDKRPKMKELEKKLGAALAAEQASTKAEGGAGNRDIGWTLRQAEVRYGGEADGGGGAADDPVDLSRASVVSVEFSGFGHDDAAYEGGEDAGADEEAAEADAAPAEEWDSWFDSDDELCV